MGEIKISRLPRVNDIDAIFNGDIPLAIDCSGYDTKKVNYKTALNSVTNCLNAVYSNYSDVSSFTTFLSSVQKTNLACIGNLLFSAGSAYSELENIDGEIQGLGTVSCFTTLCQGVCALDNVILQNITDVKVITDGIEILNDTLNIKSFACDASTLEQHVTGLNTSIENNQSNISLLNTNISNKADQTCIDILNQCLETLNTNLVTSSLYIDVNASNLTNLCTLYSNNSALINANEIKSLSAAIDNNSGSATANASTVETLITRMSDITSVSAIELASLANRVDTLETNLAISGARVYGSENNTSDLESTINTTISSVRNLSANRDIIFTDINSNASNLNTLETDIVTSAARTFANETNLTELDASLTTTISAIRNLSAFSELMTTCTEGKATTNKVDTLDANITLSSASITNNFNRTTQLSSEFDAITATTVTPDISSIKTSLVGKATTLFSEDLSSQVLANSAIITSLANQTTTLTGEILSINSTSISAISSQLANTKYSGSFSALTAKAGLSDRDYICGEIDTLTLDVDFTQDCNRTFDTQVEFLSNSTVGFISGCIDARATCTDINNIITCLDSTTGDIFIRSTDCNCVLDNLEVCVTNVTDNLKTLIGLKDPSLIASLVGNLRSDTNTISTNLNKLSADTFFDTLSTLSAVNDGLYNTVFNGISSTVDNIGTDVDALCALTDTLNFSADNLECKTVFLVDALASKTCTDGLGTDINTNLGRIKLNESNTKFLSGQIVNLSAASMNFLSGFIDVKATVACVDTINNGLLTSAGIVETNKICGITLDTKITSLSNNISGLFLVENDKFDARVNTSRIDSLSAEIETVAASARAMCVQYDTMDVLISAYNGTENAQLAEFERLEAKNSSNEGSVLTEQGNNTVLNTTIQTNNNSLTGSLSGNSGITCTLGSQVRDVCNLKSCAEAFLGPFGPVEASKVSLQQICTDITKFENDCIATRASITDVNALTASALSNEGSVTTISDISIQASCDACEALNTIQTSNSDTSEISNKLNNAFQKIDTVINNRNLIQVDANGAIAGIDIISNVCIPNCGNNIIRNEFRVNANCFKVQNPLGNDCISPFVIEDNTVKIESAELNFINANVINTDSLNIAGVAIDDSLGTVVGKSFDEITVPRFNKTCTICSEGGCGNDVTSLVNNNHLFQPQCELDPGADNYNAQGLGYLYFHSYPNFLRNPPYHVAEFSLSNYKSLTCGFRLERHECVVRDDDATGFIASICTPQPYYTGGFRNRPICSNVSNPMYAYIDFLITKCGCSTNHARDIAYDVFYGESYSYTERCWSAPEMATKCVFCGYKSSTSDYQITCANKVGNPGCQYPSRRYSRSTNMDIRMVCNNMNYPAGSILGYDYRNSKLNEYGTPGPIQHVSFKTSNYVGVRPHILEAGIKFYPGNDYHGTAATAIAIKESETPDDYLSPNPDDYALTAGKSNRDIMRDFDNGTFGRYDLNPFMHNQDMGGSTFLPHHYNETVLLKGNTCYQYWMFGLLAGQDLLNNRKGFCQGYMNLSRLQSNDEVINLGFIPWGFYPKNGDYTNFPEGRSFECAVYATKDPNTCDFYPHECGIYGLPTADMTMINPTNSQNGTVQFGNLFSKGQFVGSSDGNYGAFKASIFTPGIGQKDIWTEEYDTTFTFTSLGVTKTCPTTRVRNLFAAQFLPGVSDFDAIWDGIPSKTYIPKDRCAVITFNLYGMPLIDQTVYSKNRFIDTSGCVCISEYNSEFENRVNKITGCGFDNAPNTDDEGNPIADFLWAFRFGEENESFTVSNPIGGTLPDQIPNGTNIPGENYQGTFFSTKDICIGNTCIPKNATIIHPLNGVMDNPKFNEIAFTEVFNEDTFNARGYEAVMVEVLYQEYA